MKKLFYVVFGINLFFIGQSFADFCFTINNYCYWCNTQGPSPGAYCDRGYAGCTNTDQILKSNGSIMEDRFGRTWKCTYSGWCYSSCSWVTPTYRYVDIGGGYARIEANNTGCFCTEWGRAYINGNSYVCSDGYYGTPNTSGCTICPKYTNAAGQSFNGDSEAGNNNSITDCWMNGNNGPFKAATGAFEIITDKCMYSNFVVKPGGSVIPGGTIVTPAN